MATYNFTVRATDNSGAYADRNFSMTVNNTQIDRFMAVANAGLARSQDGITWNTELGITGDRVAWENNLWVVSSANGMLNIANQPIRTSIDGINWKTLNPVIKDYRAGYNYSLNGWNGTNAVKYRKGAWYSFPNVYQNTASYFYSDEYTSSDLVNWYNTGRNLGNYYSSNNGYADGVQDFEYDPTGDNWIAIVSSYGTGSPAVYRRNGTGAWTNITSSLLYFASAVPLNAGQTSNTSSRVGGKVYFQNGLWVVSNGASGVWTSVDSVNWTYRDTNPVISYGIAGPVFSNGRLLLLPLSNVSTANGGAALLQSVNAGHTWTARTIVSVATSPYYYTASLINRGLIDTYAGTTVAVSRNLSTIATTKDDGLNWTVSPNFSGSVGNFFAIAARNT